MDHHFKRDLKAVSLVFAILILAGCSSSKVDSSSENPETAASTELMSDDPMAAEAGGSAVAEANTDAVPAAPTEEVPAPPADLASAPTETTPPPIPDVTTSEPSTPPPIVEEPKTAELTPPPVPDSNPSLAQEPAPTSLAASTNPPPAPIELPQVDSQSPSTTSSVGSVSGELTQYRVKRGDTLMKIAFENYGDLYRWKEILDGNQNTLKDPNELAPGTVLMLSGAGMVTIERNGEKYLIKTGDTLGLISNEVYGTQAKWKKLWENNRQMIKNPNRIYAGFNLYYLPESRMTQDQSLPFKGSEEPSQVATGPGGGDAERVPNSEK